MAMGTTGVDALLGSWDLSLYDKAASTRRLYAEVLHAFAKTLPEGQSLLEVSKRDCQAYFGEMKARGLAQATIRSRWVALRSFYGWLAEEEEIAENPMRGVKVEKPEPPMLPMLAPEDLTRLFKACSGPELWDKRDLAMIRLTAATGLRIGELCALTLSDLDLRERIVTVRHGKGDKMRVARFDRETASKTDRYLRARGQHRLGHLPALWLTRFGPFGIKGAQAMLKRRCELAGIEFLPWHRLRHRFAHEWLSRGGQEGDLEKLGGWSGPAVMRRYGSALATERALDAYDELGGVL